MLLYCCSIWYCPGKRVVILKSEHKALKGCKNKTYPKNKSFVLEVNVLDFFVKLRLKQRGRKLHVCSIYILEALSKESVNNLLHSLPGYLSDFLK